MDNSVKPTVNNPTTASNSAPAAVDKTQVQTIVPNRGGIPITPAAPQQGESSSNKEHEPGTHSKLDVDKMSEEQVLNEEKAVERELEKIVAESPDTEKPNIPEEVKKIGVDLAREEKPVPVTPIGAIKFPMTYDEAKLFSKKSKITSSITWLAAIVMYHIKKLSLKNKAKEE